MCTQCDKKMRSQLTMTLYNATARFLSSQPEFLGVRGSGLGLSRTTTQRMVKESATRWRHEVKFASSPQGYSGKEDQENNFIETGDSLEIEFYFVDRDGSETRMKGPAFKVPLPQTMVSQRMESWPTHKFYPFFFQEEGKRAVRDAMGVAKLPRRRADILR